MRRLKWASVGMTIKERMASTIPTVEWSGLFLSTSASTPS
jgi:hypothetical protein